MREHQRHCRLRPNIQMAEHDTAGQDRRDIVGKQAETYAIADQVQIAENISGALRYRRPEAGSLAELGDRVVQFRGVLARNHDERVLVEIADAQQLPVRQAMFGRKADHQLFLEQRLDHRVFKNYRPAQKSDVQRVIRESNLLLCSG